MINHTHQGWILLLGRILLAAIFALSGFSKITGFVGTVAFAASAGVPMASIAIILAIILELGGALLLILGWQARWGALALILFTVLATAFFHMNLGDQIQQVMFMKNVAIIGGLLYVFVFGAGRLSLNAKQKGSTESPRPAM